MIIHKILFLNLCCLCLIFSECRNTTGDVLVISLEDSKKVTPVIYGWHYEEIGMIGDGGLYAEMVRNRGLEEANPPLGLEEVDGAYLNVPDPHADNPRKKPYRINPLVGWDVLTKADEQIKISLDSVNPLNENNPHSLKVEIFGHNTGTETGACFFNSGFFGMSLVNRCTYRLSFYARADNFSGPLKVYLSDSTGAELSNLAEITGLGKEWKKFEAEFTAMSTQSDAVLLFMPSAPGTLWLDMVSLFPGDTWDNGRSVFRSDIMQNLADYAPEFIRFPGGCIVHGVNVETMYYWKTTIGDISQRPGAWSKWEPHYRTDGLGYHEFYELCEYLGADAMYVAPSGMVCTEWVFHDGESDHYFHPEVNVQFFIQDALDAIEYAIGPADSEWGSKRAANGHPATFPLKYIEIGNEDFGPLYYQYYDTFYLAIKKRYPDLKIIANSIIGNTPDRTDKRKRLPEFKDPATLEIFDEHYYKDIPWLLDNMEKFDRYERPGPDLFIGELGIRGEHPLDVLGEAIFLINMERNADLDPMMADRPLMRNWDFVNEGINPLYFHTNDKSFKTFNYYMSKLFRDNKTNVYYSSEHLNDGVNPGYSEDYLFTSAGRDPETGELVLKVVNLSAEKRKVVITPGIKFKAEAIITVLSAPEGQQNTPEDMNAVAPLVTKRTLRFPARQEISQKSLTIFRFSLPEGS